MYHFHCQVLRGNSKDLSLPAMVSVSCVTYEEVLGAMLMTCADGSLLVKEMSAEDYERFINDIGMSFAGSTVIYVSIDHVGAFTRYPSLDEAMTLHNSDCP